LRGEKPHAMSGLLGELTTAFAKGGVDLAALGLGWARAAPSVTLVPAFGLRAMPAAARVTLAVAIGASAAPALAHLPHVPGPWPVALLVELAKGLPVAIAASVALWTATMAGGLVDDLRGGRESSNLPHVEQGATATGALTSMLVAIAFLESGGPARIAARIADPTLGFSEPLARAAANLASGVEMAVAVATPIVVASIVIEVSSALVARAASPAFVQPLLAPLRSLALLGVAALVLERMVGLLAVMAGRGV
jgi:flagellar biosynthesis protein FliR